MSVARHAMDPSFFNVSAGSKQFLTTTLKHYIIPKSHASTMTAIGEFGRPGARHHMLIVWQTVAMSAT
jgi:hypothetical protein